MMIVFGAWKNNFNHYQLLKSDLLKSCNSLQDFFVEFYNLNFLKKYHCNQNILDYLILFRNATFYKVALRMGINNHLFNIQIIFNQ